MNAVITGLLTPYIGTSAGASCVFFLKKDLKRGVQRALTGFAAGVMVAASIWSLIVPAIEQSSAMGQLGGSGNITAGGALALALGIAIQNFPEGAIISMPLYAKGKSMQGHLQRRPAVSQADDPLLRQSGENEDRKDQFWGVRIWHGKIRIIRRSP